MAQIDSFLQHQIDASSAVEITVIITLKDEAELPESIQGKANFILQDKIAAATLTGAQIEELANHPSIEAIESDGPVHTM